MTAQPSELQLPAVKILIVDDDRAICEYMQTLLERDGYAVKTMSDPTTIEDEVKNGGYHLIILDLMMPKLDGIEALKKIRKIDSDVAVVIFTGYPNLETAVASMKLDAVDYIKKPFNVDEFREVLDRVMRKKGLARTPEEKLHKVIGDTIRNLRKENLQLKALLDRTQPPANMVGNSPAMQEVYRLIQRAGPSDKAILILGESGTGKELVARALHRASSRADKPMVVINCAALPETLLESELFGHEKGAFTGAINTKAGLFEVADGGTLFIDEIGELPGPLQAKLLRVLEDGSLRRIGSVQERRVKVRLLAATNRDLAKEVESKRFREDLYYRINVMSLELPPLRERQGDIPLLVHHFLGPGWEIDPEALRRMEQYHWPGNVRQLINALERAKILSDSETITTKDLPREVYARAADRAEVASNLPLPSTDDLAAIQRSKVVEVLRREQGNKSKAARALGIDRRKLYRLLEKFSISDGEIDSLERAT